MPDQTCLNCGKPLHPTKAEQREGRKTTRRTHCGAKCAGASRRIVSKPKPCEHCGSDIPFPPSMKASRYKQQRFCSRECGYANRTTRVDVQCDTCGETVSRHPNDIHSHNYCSVQCRHIGQRDRKTLTCPTCLNDFEVVAGAYRVHCSTDCMAEAYRQRLKGEGNPNYGNRYVGAWQMPGETRLHLSKMKRGRGNPNHKSGSTDQKRLFGGYVSRWAAENLSASCESCDTDATCTHHIVPRRLFAHHAQSHFRRNLVRLCHSCHKTVETQIDEAQIRQIPFADRLPESILLQLETDGFVSRLPEDVDLSPLGNVAAELLSEEHFDTAA